LVTDHQIGFSWGCNPRVALEDDVAAVEDDDAHRRRVLAVQVGVERRRAGRRVDRMVGDRGHRPNRQRADRAVAVDVDRRHDLVEVPVAPGHCLAGLRPPDLVGGIGQGPVLAEVLRDGRSRFEVRRRLLRGRAGCKCQSEDEGASSHGGSVRRHPLQSIVPR